MVQSYFRNLINIVLNGLSIILGYLDDIIILSETAEQALFL